MAQQKVVPKKIRKFFLQTFILSFLVSCFICFFMKDQMVTFMKGRTTITRRVENVNSVEFPTITICFDPATKLSVAKKYGFESHNDKFYRDIPNRTLSQIFDEMSYGFDEDYSIWNYNGKKVNLGLPKLPYLFISFCITAIFAGSAGSAGSNVSNTTAICGAQ